MDRFVFNKEMYFYEIERRHKLNAALSMPVGVATILGSFLYFYAANLTFKGWDHLLNWIQPFCVCPQTKPLEWGDLHGFSFDIILFVSFLCWFIAVFFLMRAIWPGEYAYLPTPNVLEKYRQDMIAWNDGRKPPMKDKKRENSSGSG